MIRPFVDALVRLAKESSQGAILASEKTVSDWLRRAGSSADAKRTALDALDRRLLPLVPVATTG